MRRILLAPLALFVLARCGGSDPAAPSADAGTDSGGGVDSGVGGAGGGGGAGVDSGSDAGTDAPTDAPPDAGEDAAAEAGADAAVSSLGLRAGSLGGPGNRDAAGGAARFNGPGSVAVDGAGNVYVADTLNSTIRKITPAGAVTTLAGTSGASGSADGTGAAARFFQPTGVAADSAGNLFVADGNQTIRKITPLGIVTTLAGTAGAAGSADGTGAAARFHAPAGVAVDGAGNVFVADGGNHTVREITPAGIVSTIAGTAGSAGSADGTGAAARFQRPVGVAVDAAGNVFVSDQYFCTIRKITPAGVVTTFAGSTAAGSADGHGAAALFKAPAGLAVDGAGDVFVADDYNDTVRKITPTGDVTTVAGSAGVGDNVDATGATARFNHPTGVAVDSAGNVFVADSGNQSIREISSAGAVTTFAGRGAMLGSDDGTGAAARFALPAGVAVDSANNAIVADALNHTIRRVTATGLVTTLAGSPGKLGSADGTGAAARFSDPRGIAVDAAGNAFVVERNSNAIREITPAGLVTTIAGMAGASGSADGTGSAARFFFPAAVAADAAGNVFVADWGNDTIRKITTAGLVTTIAGITGTPGSADGAAAAATFKGVAGVAVDSAGNLFVADAGNQTIRKVSSAGVVSTIAGTVGVRGSADGVGVAATFNNPTGVAVDAAGNVFVTDAGNDAIRQITPAGVVTTVVGVPGQTGVLLGPLPGGLDLSLGGAGIAATPSGNLVVTSENSVLDVLFR